MQSNIDLRSKTNHGKVERVDLNPFWTGRSHVQRLGVKPIDKLRAFRGSKGP